jgi:outer membrane protein TolC
MRNAADAANHRYLSSMEGRNFMVTELVADIANTYYELLALDNQVEVLKRNIEIQKDALDVVRTQLQAAQVTLLAVQRFEAEVLKNRSRLFALEQRRIETENHINFLVGRFPQPVARHSQRFKEPLPNVIQAGIPSQLLDNRPDLKAAAQDLTAAELDVKSAKASFYPRLSVEAGVGYAAFNLHHLVMTPESLAYNAAANLATPLINRRAIKAEYYAANAEQIRAVFNYEQTILKAVTEVANLLNMMKNLQSSYDLQSQQVSLLEQAIDVSGVLFQSARADYMEVLLTRRDALDAEMELIETKKEQLRAMVDVYQALGGGWRQDEPIGDVVVTADTGDRWWKIW